MKLSSGSMNKLTAKEWTFWMSWTASFASSNLIHLHQLK